MLSANYLTCCCGLRTGGMVAGVLDIIFGTIFTVFSFLGFTIVTAAEEYDHPSARKVPIYIYAGPAIFLISGIFLTSIGLFLLVAVNKKSEYLLKVWMILKTLVLILNFALSVIFYTRIIESPHVFQIIAPNITTIFGLWFIAVVYFLRREFINN